MILLATILSPHGYQVGTIHFFSMLSAYSALSSEVGHAAVNKNNRVSGFWVSDTQSRIKDKGTEVTFEKNFYPGGTLSVVEETSRSAYSY